jgi:transcriptional regulator with XRE-family HTH domain
MKLSSDTQLAKELSDRETREQTVASQIRTGIPFQLRAMRERRKLTQERVAEMLETSQNAISRLENPKTSKPTIKTLLRIARAFDVGLLVRFVPFGFYGEVIESMGPDHIEVPSYVEELQDELDSQTDNVGEQVGAIDQEPQGAGILAADDSQRKGVLIEKTPEEWQNLQRAQAPRKQPHSEVGLLNVGCQQN